MQGPRRCTIADVYPAYFWSGGTVREFKEYIARINSILGYPVKEG